VASEGVGSPTSKIEEGGRVSLTLKQKDLLGRGPEMVPRMTFMCLSSTWLRMLSVMMDNV
jgi:hypothetical protein